MDTVQFQPLAGDFETYLNQTVFLTDAYTSFGLGDFYVVCPSAH